VATMVLTTTGGVDGFGASEPAGVTDLTGEMTFSS